jgi:hypothetical protein
MIQNVVAGLNGFVNPLPLAKADVSAGKPAAAATHRYL